MNRSEWLNNLKPIMKGSKLDQKCVVIVFDKNKNFAGYGTITRITKDRIYFNHFTDNLVNRSQWVNKETGKNDNYYLQSLNLSKNENELVLAKEAIGKVLKNEQKKIVILSLRELIEQTIAVLEKDTKINPVLRYQTLANLYQILEESHKES